MLIGIVLRLKGIGYKKDKKKVKGGKPSNKDEEEFYTPDAYVEHGDGGESEWKDGGLYDAKEGKGKGTFSDLNEEKPKKGADKMESWDDY